jgi:hypothetical protein
MGGSVSTDRLTALSCAAANLCSALNTAGRVVTSSTPSDPTSWTAVTDTTAVAPIACPSATLCVAAGMTADSS